MRLVLDHHYSPRIAAALRDRGHDVSAAVELGWHTDDDHALLERCAASGATLLTNNVADFAVIARGWQAEGRSHAGLVFTSDSRLPRSRDTIGRYVALLDALVAANAEAEAFTDRIHWL